MADTAMAETASLLTSEVVNQVQPDSFRAHSWASSCSEDTDWGRRGNGYSATIYTSRFGD